MVDCCDCTHDTLVLWWQRYNKNVDMTRGASADESGPLRGPFRCAPVSPGHTDLRPVRPGVTSSQGRWPCQGLRPYFTGDSISLLGKFPHFPPCSHVRGVSSWPWRPVETQPHLPLFPHFPPCSHVRGFSTVGWYFVESRVYSGNSGKVKKRKQRPQNSKNMFSVACREGKMQYLRSL